MPNKTKPCPECGANGRQKHALSCSIGQARSFASRKAHAARQAKSKTPPTRRPVTKTLKPAVQAAVKPLVNRIALVLDASSSMNPVYDLAVDCINRQIEEIKRQSQDRGQASYVTVYTFADTVHRPLVQNAFIHSVLPVHRSHFSCGGMTALFDAIGQAISDFERLPDANDPNTSFLIMPITDGEENKSRVWNSTQLAHKIRTLQALERWTFTFSGPLGSARRMQNLLGIHPGNTSEWENSREGTTAMTQTLKTGMDVYYGARSAGLRSTKTFFTTDMSQVSTRDLKSLKNVKDEFKSLSVERECEIRQFVEDQLAKNSTLRRQVGDQYQLGKAYYELTKPEDVQPQKDILVLDKSTGKLYGGHEARGIIGMPTSVDVRVKPGNHMNFSIFVKSTSVNRKLVRGTKVMYRVR